jgi:hypothetical protein
MWESLAELLLMVAGLWLRALEFRLDAALAGGS